nr:MAG TPA: hypothetical protein [Caudoviricetes sp.]
MLNKSYICLVLHIKYDKAYPITTVLPYLCRFNLLLCHTK